MSDVLNATLGKVRQRFVASLPEVQESLAQDLRRLSDAPGEALHLEETKNNAHKIAGVSPTLGFEALGARAAEVDLLIGPDAAQNAQNRNEIVSGIETLLGEIGTVLKAS